MEAAPRCVQVVAQHPLGLRSLWDERIADANPLGGEVEEQLFTTWKIRTDGQAQRVIDYIWCVAQTMSPRPDDCTYSDRTLEGDAVQATRAFQPA